MLHEIFHPGNSFDCQTRGNFACAQEPDTCANLRSVESYRFRSMPFRRKRSSIVHTKTISLLVFLLRKGGDTFRCVLGSTVDPDHLHEPQHAFRALSRGMGGSERARPAERNRRSLQTKFLSVTHRKRSRTTDLSIRSCVGVEGLENTFSKNRASLH